MIPILEEFLPARTASACRSTTGRRTTRTSGPRSTTASTRSRPPRPSRSGSSSRGGPRTSSSPPAAWLTRLDAVVSPEEMAVDPLFGFNLDLPEVNADPPVGSTPPATGERTPERGRARASTLPDGTRLPLPAEVDLPPGRVDHDLARAAHPPRRDRGDAALGETGPGEVIADYTDELVVGAAAHRLPAGGGEPRLRGRRRLRLPGRGRERAAARRRWSCCSAAVGGRAKPSRHRDDRTELAPRLVAPRSEPLLQPHERGPADVHAHYVVRFQGPAASGREHRARSARGRPRTGPRTSRHTLVVADGSRSTRAEPSTAAVASGSSSTMAVTPASPWVEPSTHRTLPSTSTSTGRRTAAEASCGPDARVPLDGIGVARPPAHRGRGPDVVVALHADRRADEVVEPRVDHVLDDAGAEPGRLDAGREPLDTRIESVRDW